MRTFGWTKPIRSEDGDIVAVRPSPIKARTLNALGGTYGCDKDKRLVVTCHAGDLIGLRPERTTREVTISVFDVYLYALRCQANLVHLEKARAKKSAKAQRLANQRQARAERKLFSAGRSHFNEDRERKIGK